MTHKPEKPKGLIMPVQDAGDKMTVHPEQDHEAMLMTEEATNDTFLDISFFTENAIIDDTMDSLIGGLIERELMQSGVERPFLYAETVWKQIDFERVAQIQLTSKEVVVVSNKDANFQTMELVEWDNDFARKNLYMLLNRLKHLPPEKLASWASIAYLRISPEKAAQVMTVGKPYIIPGALVRCGVYQVPVVVFRNGVVDCMLMPINSIVDSSMGILTV